MSTPDAVLALRIPPRPHLSRIVRERVGRFAAQNGIEGDDLDHFLSALGEAVANAIEHAGSEAPIELECRISADRISATVSDAGVGFTHEPELTAGLPEGTSERGRGLPIMRRCSDVLDVITAPGHGTAVRLSRFLRGSEKRGIRNGVPAE